MFIIFFLILIVFGAAGIALMAFGASVYKQDAVPVLDRPPAHVRTMRYERDELLEDELGREEGDGRDPIFLEPPPA